MFRSVSSLLFPHRSAIEHSTLVDHANETRWVAARRIIQSFRSNCGHYHERGFFNELLVVLGDVIELFGERSWYGFAIQRQQIFDGIDVVFVRFRLHVSIRRRFEVTIAQARCTNVIVSNQAFAAERRYNRPPHF
jgi:hypothetical protein